jgi:membrane associated rhomboid family serine protease
MEASRAESQIVGHRSVENADKSETWRFFVPIFLHVGIVHFLLNMVAQVFAGSQVEKEMGTLHPSACLWRLTGRLDTILNCLLCWWFVRQYSRRKL